MIPTGLRLNTLNLVNNDVIVPYITQGSKLEAPTGPSVGLVDKNSNKIHDDLEMQLQDYGPDDRIEVVVSFDAQPTQNDITAIKELGGTILQVYSVIPACRVQIPRKTIPELAKIGSVVMIEGLATCKPLLLDSTRQARERPYVWDRGYEGDPNTAIAIIDSGIDATHPDLAGKVVYWQDFSTDASPTPVDFMEHGTHCASVAAGTGAHSDGEYFEETYGNMTSDAVGSQNYYHTKTYSTGNLTLGITWNNEVTGDTPFLRLGVKNSSMIQMSTNFSTSPYTWTASIPLSPGIYDLIVENNQSAGSRSYVIAAKIPAGDTGDNYPEHLRGAAPGSKIVALKAFTNDGVGTLPSLLSALDWVHNNYRNYNITTVSMSLGFTSIISSVDDAVNNLVQQDGVIVVVAAGNYFQYGLTVCSPGSASACITVGAVNKANQITTYSSNGDWSSNPGGKPDIVAPGGSIATTGLAPNLGIVAADSSYTDTAGFDYVHYQMLYQPDPYFGSYQQMAGTSMACPHVAGIAQLLINAWPGGWNWNPADALKIKQIICMSGVEVNSGESPSQVPTLDRGSKDLKEGWGKINADAAINLTRDNLDFFKTYAIQFGNGTSDLKNFGGRVFLETGRRYNFTLSVPSGCDADLYLWSPHPTAIGDPILITKSTSAIMGQSENIITSVNETGYYYLTAKVIQGSLVSVANLTLDQIITMKVQNPLPYSLSLETTGVQFNISVYGAGGTYDTTWYSLDGGEDNITFSGNACVAIPRGFHQVIFYANDSNGEVASDPIPFALRSSHPEDHATLTITDPVNGEVLTGTQSITLKVMFTTDLGMIDACWFIFDYDPPMMFSGVISLGVSPGPHRIIVYANNTLGEQISSQIIKFTVSEETPIDLMAYIYLVLVGAAIGAIASCIHYVASKPPRPRKRPVAPVLPAQTKFSFAKAGAYSSGSSISPTSSPTTIKPSVPSSSPPPTKNLMSEADKLLKLLHPTASGDVEKNAGSLGTSPPSPTPALNEIKCPQCGAKLPAGTKMCPFCKFVVI